MTFYDRLTQRLLRGPVESTQLTSGDYQRMLAQHGIVCSMSRRATAGTTPSPRASSPR